MKLTTFNLFKNTPLTKFNEVIYFKDEKERRDYFFESGYFEVVRFESRFNYVYDRLVIRVPKNYYDIADCNYCHFFSDWDEINYYAFITDRTYINDEVTQITVVIDVFTTFFVGNKLSTYPNMNIERQHLDSLTYAENELRLLTNNDKLQTTTNEYIHQEFYEFKDLQIIFTSSVDLAEKFGTVDKPELHTSVGQTYDRITSPQNMYTCSKDNFNKLMDKLKKYPWITQNFKSIIQVPKDMIKESELEEAKISINFTGLKKFKDGSLSENLKLNSLNKTKNQLQSIFKIDNKNKYLLRSGICNIEITAWNGNMITPQVEFMTSLTLDSRIVTGYNNAIAIFLKDYKTTSTEQDIKNQFGNVGVPRGTFLNDALFINQFDSVSMLIDNYQLSMSQNANQRALNDSRRTINRIDNVRSGTDTESRVMDAINLSSNFGGGLVFNGGAKAFGKSLVNTGVQTGGNLGGRLTDDYEYYRTQKAQFDDMAMNSPTVTEQSYANGLSVANGFYGISVKYSRCNDNELKQLIKYYNLMGFETNFQNEKISTLESMSICNYVKASGNLTTDGVDIAFTTQAEALLESGVRFWKWNNLKNPFSQNVLENKKVI